MQLVRDLGGAASTFEQANDLDLPRCKARVRRQWLLVVDVEDLAEDTDDVMVARQRNGADLDCDAFASGRVVYHDTVVRPVGGPVKLR